MRILQIGLGLDSRYRPTLNGKHPIQAQCPLLLDGFRPVFCSLFLSLLFGVMFRLHLWVAGAELEVRFDLIEQLGLRELDIWVEKVPPPRGI